MSNASPLKEPSMDEILASIRRIIESGDERPNASVRPRAVSDSLRARAIAMQAEGAPGLRAGPGLVDAAKMPAADHETAPGLRNGSGHAADPVVTEEPAEEAEDAADWSTPLASLASLSANDRPAPSLRRAVPEVEPPRAAEHEDEASLPASHEFHDKPATAARPHPAAPEFGDGLTLAGLRPASVEYPSRVEGAAAAAEPAPEPAPYDFNLEFDEESFSSELRDEVVSAFSQAEPEAGDYDRDYPGESFAVPPVAEAAPPSLIAETSSLMSEAAGAQVASAFDELARAIREGQMKSMEEMARHMLRPMLQEWLDDNLPRIVERLVREEIERVARGGRR